MSDIRNKHKAEPSVDFANFEQDNTRDDLLSDFARKTLENRYIINGETYQDFFSRIAIAYADDAAHARRLYKYISKMWLMPATPVLTNGGTSEFTRWKLLKSPKSYPSSIAIPKRGLPISCFLNESQDSLSGIISVWNENVWISANGGGIGTYWGNLRSVGEKVRGSGSSGGVMPFIKVMDSQSLAISQGNLRRGASAAYLNISHPEIEEFVEFRKPTGGDHNRKSLNIHHGVVITDDFMKAVQGDKMWDLKSPKDGSVVSSLSARALMAKILNTRVETGEPYILFIDSVNENIPEAQKKLGLHVKTSNLCSEITLPTGVDHKGEKRTAVCCLSSLNLSKFDEWENEELFIEDALRFLDNVLEDFINTAPDELSSAVYSAQRERSIGLGVMGWHEFLQKNMLPMDGVIARGWNNKIFQQIRDQAEAASKKIGNERGSCLDIEEAGLVGRFSNITAIAPTASISIIADTSPGIDPVISNAYTHKTIVGSFIMKNHMLEALLDKKGLNTDEIWDSIVCNEGSVQQLECLSDDEKRVFRTAFEIKQSALVNLAADRQEYISQSQSLNLYFLADVHKQELWQIHKLAWERGIKSLYYIRSKSLQRTENSETAKKNMPIPNLNTEPELPYNECEACQ